MIYVRSGYSALYQSEVGASRAQWWPLPGYQVSHVVVRNVVEAMDVSY